MSDILPLPTDSAALLAEYKALRDEILKRIEMGNQFLAFILVALGTVLTVGFTNQKPTLLLLFPILMFFSTLVLYPNTNAVVKLGHYIRTQIEPLLKSGAQGWETSLYVGKKTDTFYLLSNLSFLGASGIIVVIGYYLRLTSQFTPLEISLLVIATICWIATIFTVLYFNRLLNRLEPSTDSKI